MELKNFWILVPCFFLRLYFYRVDVVFLPVGGVMEHWELSSPIITCAPDFMNVLTTFRGSKLGSKMCEIHNNNRRNIWKTLSLSLQPDLFVLQFVVLTVRPLIPLQPFAVAASSLCQGCKMWLFTMVPVLVTSVLIMKTTGVQQYVKLMLEWSELIYGDRASMMSVLWLREKWPCSGGRFPGAIKTTTLPRLIYQWEFIVFPW